MTSSTTDRLAAGLRDADISVTMDVPVDSLIEEGQARPGLGTTLTAEQGPATDTTTPTSRRDWLILPADPDAPALLPDYPLVPTEDGLPRSLPFVEAARLQLVGDALIARCYPALKQLRMAYLWSPDLGKVSGEPRLWRLRKADDWTRWALERGSQPRLVDLFVLLNSTVATYAQLTNWQVQAALHEALACVVVRDRMPQIQPRSLTVQTYIIRRYGAWDEAVKVVLAAAAAANTAQLPLWSDAEEDDEEEGE